MWCTRWYLPLLLLPLPTAPPYMLALFIFSLTIDARPCFYCIVLLSSLFLSSCYWQPIPLESSLSHPWSENIITFADALNASLTPTFTSTSVQVPLPSTVRPIDRCWCDFSSGSFFEPFNVTEWERASVEKLAKEVEGQSRLVEALTEAVEEDKKSQAAESDSSPTRSPIAKPRLIMSLLRSIYRSADQSQKPSDSSFRPLQSDVLPQQEKAQAPVETPQRLPLLRKEYDLREYGMDLIIDFGWNRRQKQGYKHVMPSDS